MRIVKGRHVQVGLITSNPCLVLVVFRDVPNTVRHKILTGENIDEFDEFPAIRQYFPYQNFPFSYVATYMK